MPELYTGTNDGQLLKDIVHGAGKFFVKKIEASAKGTMGTPGATAIITLPAGIVTADDEFNTMTLYMVDDDNELTYVDIDDTTLATPSITVDTTASLKVKDRTTAGNFTAATQYDLYIAGLKKYLGFAEFNFNVEVEDEVFEDDENMPVRTDIVRVKIMCEGELKNFGGAIFVNIYTMQEYGDNTGTKEEYHSGFDLTRDEYMAIIEFTDVAGKDWTLEFFRGLFKPSGAVDMKKGYKRTPFVYNALVDVLRDSRDVSGYSLSTPG